VKKKVSIGSLNFNCKCFAISLWFNPESLTQDARFVSKAINNNIQNHIVSAQIFNQKLKFRLKLGQDLNTGTSQFQTTGDPIDTANIWYHAVFWFDGCEVRLYLNGVKQTIEETQIGGGINASTAFEPGKKVFQGAQEVTIGSQPQLGASFPGFRAFDGCLDQIIIWKSAISEAIIEDLHNSGDGSNCVKDLQTNQIAFEPYSRKVALTSFRWLVTITTQNLCEDFKCGFLSVKVVDEYDRVCQTLVDQITNLADWPGIIEVLDHEDKLDDKDNEVCKRTFKIRLNLDINQLCLCPLDVKDKTIKLCISDCAGAFDLDESKVTIMGIKGDKCDCCPKKRCH